MLITHANPVCVPVWVEGAEKVLPLGAKFPRFWKTPVSIIIGAPFTVKVTSRARGWEEATEIVAAKLLELAEQQ